MPRVAPGELNPRHRKFVAEYLVSGNATQSALASGYKAASAASQGNALLQNPKIIAGLAEARAKLEINSDITQGRVLAELALLAFSSVEHYTVDECGHVIANEGAPKGAMRAISSIKRKTFTDKDGQVSREVEIKLWDKPGPLKLAGRHVGLFPDKVELTTKDDQPIAIIINGAMPVPHEVKNAIDVEASVSSETTTTLGGHET